MAGTTNLHRTRDRRHLELPIRIERLEEDADNFEATLAGIELKLDRLNARLLGMLISTAVGAILLAANLLSSRIGHV
jgi:DNA-binding response OmpR family regulator